MNVCGVCVFVCLSISRRVCICVCPCVCVRACTCSYALTCGYVKGTVSSFNITQYQILGIAQGTCNPLLPGRAAQSSLILMPLGRIQPCCC